MFAVSGCCNYKLQNQVVVELSVSPEAWISTLAFALPQTRFSDLQLGDGDGDGNMPLKKQIILLIYRMRKLAESDI